MNTKIKKYIICKPGGNDTAIVYGTEYTNEQKKRINDDIMKTHKNVEQVGFINVNGIKELQMAGGEFCGNATRSAAFLYLDGKEGNIEILVNSKDTIKAGVYKDGKAWCEIPLYKGEDVITKKEEGIYIVKMNGMTTVVIEPEIAKRYLLNTKILKEHGMDFIRKYDLEKNNLYFNLILILLKFYFNFGPVSFQISNETHKHI